MMQTPAEAVADPVAFISRFPGLSEKKAKKIQVKLFGAFGLAVDGAPVGNEVWKTRKISGILKYILANAGKAVPRETLAAVFWPDSNAKAAFSSLRVAIFELRKTLSSFGMAFDSPDALISEDKNGFFVCSPDYVQSDANLFSGLYEKSKAADLPAEEKGALLQQMTDLYDGDFLADDVRDDWIVVLREYYKSIYVAASHQLAELYRKNGQAGQAEALLLKHIQVDPYDEAACRKLMDLFTASGREVQASTLHDQFKRRANQQAAAAPTPD